MWRQNSNCPSSTGNMLHYKWLHTSWCHRTFQKGDSSRAGVLHKDSLEDEVAEGQPQEWVTSLQTPGLFPNPNPPRLWSLEKMT